MPVILGQSFWNKLSSISESVGLKPADLLEIIYFESAGINPAAHNPNGDASGLIQFAPGTLKDVGYQGSPAEFRQESADRQLDFVSRYVSDHAKSVGGSFKSAAQYYVANLWPAALKLEGVQNENPETPIIEKDPQIKKYPGVSLAYERAAYNENRVLDTDHDGVISYGDLEKTLNNVKQSAGFQHALQTLSSGGEFTVGSKAPASSTPASSQETDLLSQIENKLKSLYQAVAFKTIDQNIMIKKSARNNLLSNNFCIKINSTDFNTSVEFARLLCLALEEELLAEGYICTDGKNVELSCSIPGRHLLVTKTTQQLCATLSEVFEESTIKLGGYKVKSIIYPNQLSSYQPLGVLSSEACYTNFHSRFYDGS